MQVGSSNFPPVFASSHAWMTGLSKFTTPKLPEYGDYPSNFTTNQPYDSLYIGHAAETVHASWPTYGHLPQQGLGNLVVAAQKYLRYSAM